MDKEYACFIHTQSNVNLSRYILDFPIKVGFIIPVILIAISFGSLTPFLRINKTDIISCVNQHFIKKISLTDSFRKRRVFIVFSSCNGFANRHYFD
jgi:hypothetical protein